MNAIDLIVEDDAWTAIKGKTRLVEKAVAAASDEAEALEPGVVAILLTGDEAVADLNSRFRDKTGPTNVLSFPAAEGADNHLGDIALAWGVVQREADERGLSLEAHLSHLVVHGFLHLQGYDHLEDEEAELMEGLERRALSQLGFADPYADRGVDDTV